MSLWRYDHSELKALEKQQIPEGHSNLPFLPKTGDKNSRVKDALPVPAGKRCSSIENTS